MKKLLQQIERIKSAEESLSEWEKSFVKSIAERAEKYGETLNVSEKQKAVIAKIFEERVGAGKPKKVAKAAIESDPFPAATAAASTGTLAGDIPF